MANHDVAIRQTLNNIDDITKLIFFVGAGLSASAGYPLWGIAAQRALDIAKGLGLSPGAAAYAEEKLKKRAYYDLFEILHAELTDAAYYNLAAEVFDGKNEASEVQRKLVRLPVKGIITTNFDECLLSATVLERQSPPIADLATAMASDKFFVVKPHGTIQQPRTLVLRTSDWKDIVRGGVFQNFVAHAISTGQICFLGYSLADPDFNHAWDDILRNRIFRAPALYCCAEGGLGDARIAMASRMPHRW